MKRLLIFVLMFFMFCNISASGTHDGNVVLVNVDGYSMTLQEAIDNSFLRENSPLATTSFTAFLSGVSHDSSDIYISVNGVDMTLAQGIENKNLCGNTESSYSSEVIFGHTGEEINVSIDNINMTLQDAINDGLLCCLPVDGGWSDYTWSTCSGTFPNCLQTGTRSCTNPSPYCGGGSCVGSSTITRSCTGGNCVEKVCLDMNSNSYYYEKYGSSPVIGGYFEGDRIVWQGTTIYNYDAYSSGGSCFCPHEYCSSSSCISEHDIVIGDYSYTIGSLIDTVWGPKNNHVESYYEICREPI